MASGRYLLSLKQDRKTASEMSFTDAADLSCQRGGTQVTLYEYLDEDHYYVPFTDSDHYCQSKEPPSQDFIQEVLDGVFRNLHILVGSQSPENADFKMATRHGLVVEKGVYKLSFRCYLFGFKIKLRDMRDLIVSKGLDQNGLGSFDKAPYNKSQLLGCVGFAKSESDTRLLVPGIGSCSEPGILEGFMVQNLTGDEPTLINDDENVQDETDTEEPENVSEDLQDNGPRFCPPWKLLERCVMSLSIERRCEKGTYHEWTRIGWALAGVSRAAKRSNDGLELWLRFCKQSSVYYENSCAAITVFSRASNHGRRLGWTSLMEALKEDAPDVHSDIENELCPNLEDQGSLKIVKQFVKINFRRPIATIDRVILRKYDTGKFLIVTLNHKASCDFVDQDHEDGSKNYIVIGLKNARDKCPHNGCIGKQNIIIDSTQYPGDVKTIVEQLLRTVHTPEDAIRKFVLERKDTAFKDMDDDMAELGPLQKLPFCNRYQLTKNIFCPICHRKHEKPENCLLLDQAAKMLTMGCRLDPDNFHPPGGLALPSSVTNVFIQNVNILGLDSNIQPCFFVEDYENDNLPMFKDSVEQRRLFVKSFAGKHHDIAKFVHSLWHAEFRHFGGKSGKWYHFEGHIWTELEDNPVIRSRLSSSLCDLYERAQYHYRQNSGLKNAAAKIELIDRTISNLKNAHFKESVMKEIVEVFHIEHREFAKQVNSADLMPFLNGVLQLNTLELRPGRPEDKMSLSSSIEFQEFDPATEEAQALLQFLESILPDQEARNYLLKMSALCLTRETKYQKFLVCTGSGVNGKSVYLDLLSTVLGQFAKTGRISILTGKTEDASQANEALSNLEHARLVTFNEPSVNGQIQAEKMKVFSGGRDKISTRALHASEREFIPTFKMILACNSIPRMSEDSEAVWRRVRVVNFPMKFCEYPDPDDNLQGQIDFDLPTKAEAWAPQLAGYLVHWLGIIRQEGLREPSAVLSSTNAYQAENDPYADFWTDCTETETNPHKSTNITNVVPVFRKWLRENLDQKMTSEDMKRYIRKHWKEVKTTYIEKSVTLPLRGLVGRRLKSPFVVD